MTSLKTITIGDLRSDLEKLLTYPDDTLVTFGTGNLTFQRQKIMEYANRDLVVPKVVNIQFLEDYSLTFDPDES